MKNFKDKVKVPSRTTRDLGPDCLFYVCSSPPPPPSNFIAGRPKAALLFWFFGGFRCGVPLFMLVIY